MFRRKIWQHCLIDVWKAGSVDINETLHSPRSACQRGIDLRWALQRKTWNTLQTHFLVLLRPALVNTCLTHSTKTVGIQVDPVDPPGKTWNGVETLHCTVFACTPPRQLREVRKKRPGAFSAVCSRTEWGGVGRALVCELMCALAVIEWAVWSKVECDRMVRSAGKAGIIPLYWAGVANFTKTNIYPMPHASTHQQHSDAFNPTISHWTTRSTSLLWPSIQKRILYTLQVFWQGDF